MARIYNNFDFIIEKGKLGLSIGYFTYLTNDYESKLEKQYIDSMIEAHKFFKMIYKSEAESLTSKYWNDYAARSPLDTMVRDVIDHPSDDAIVGKLEKTILKLTCVNNYITDNDIVSEALNNRAEKIKPDNFSHIENEQAKKLAETKSILDKLEAFKILADDYPAKAPGVSPECIEYIKYPTLLDADLTHAFKQSWDDLVKAKYQVYAEYNEHTSYLGQVAPLEPTE
jgi:hypothetical protein